MYPYLVQGKNIVVVVDNKSYTINDSHINYQKVLAAIKDQDWATVKEVVDPKKIVLNYGRGNVAIQGDRLFWKGQELASTLAVRMIKMYQEGFSIEPMVNFMENLMQNPSKRAVNELYSFLEKSELPITPDGCFLAYKKVRGNYFDGHSGTVLNKPAHLMTSEDIDVLNKPIKDVVVTIKNDVTVVSMERNKVDDDKDRTCSTGLHFCSMGYLNSFGGERTVILKINPRDVVSIPADHNDTKGRACRYEVIGELNVEPEKAFTKTVQSMANSKQPVTQSLKTGSTPFYRGYTDGYKGKDYNSAYSMDFQSIQDRKNYEEGFEKGENHRYDNEPERYRYVAPQSQNNGAWPSPR